MYRHLRSRTSTLNPKHRTRLNAGMRPRPLSRRGAEPRDARAGRRAWPRHPEGRVVAG